MNKLNRVQSVERIKRYPGHIILLFHVMAFWVVLMFSMPGSAASAELILKPELKQHLSELKTIQTPGESNGASISLDNKVVVVTFFASWCPPCRDEFMALNSLIEELGLENVSVVAVNVFEAFDDNDEVRMAKFLDSTRPLFSVREGTDKSRELFGNVNRIPTLYVFDKTGKQAFDFVHARGSKVRSVDSSELMNAIKPLL